MCIYSWAFSLGCEQVWCMENNEDLVVSCPVIAFLGDGGGGALRYGSWTIFFK